MPLDPDDTATTARDYMLDQMWAVAPGALVEVGALNADGSELDPVDCPGYARYTVASWAGFWLPASGGSKSSNPVAVGTPTAEWLDAGIKDAIYVDGYLFDSDDLGDPLVVTAAGDPTSVTVVRTFDGAAG